MPKRKREISPEQQAAFEVAMERIKQATGARTQVQLAELLDVRQSSISDAKRRCSIPSDWLLKLQRVTKIHADWYLTGQEPKYLAGTHHATAQRLQESIDQLGQTVAVIIGRVRESLDVMGMTVAELERRKLAHSARLADDLEQLSEMSTQLENMAVDVAAVATTQA